VIAIVVSIYDLKHSNASATASAASAEAAKRSADEAVRSNTLTQKALILTHPPRIKIRTIMLDGQPSGEQAPKGRIVMENSGKTEARVTEVGIAFVVMPEHTASPASTSFDMVPVDIVIKPAERVDYKVNEGDRILQGAMPEIMGPYGRRLYAVGSIKYSDTTDPAIFTEAIAIFREYHGPSNQFRPKEQDTAG
jgi:hypothetical protein